MMTEQNFQNHSRMVPMFHYVLYLVITLCLIASLWNLFRAYEHHSGRLVAAALFGLSIGLIILGWYARTFPLAAQDRAIRAEENLRHFVLTGKLLDPRLTLPQIIALRFADDPEFIDLAARAANNAMKATEIKKAIINWRADNHRV